MQQRLKRNPFLALFDGPDPNATTPRRQVSTVPTQALYLMNSEEVHRAADVMQQALSVNAETPEDCVHLAFRRVLARDPTTAEVKSGRRFLLRYSGQAGGGNDLKTGGRQAFSALLRTLLIRNAFLFVD
jgi:hypothetical protein